MSPVRSRRETGYARVRSNSQPPKQPPAPKMPQRRAGQHEGFWVTRDGTDARVVCLTCHTGIWYCKDDPAAIEGLKQAHREEGHYVYPRIR